MFSLKDNTGVIISSFLVFLIGVLEQLNFIVFILFALVIQSISINLESWELYIYAIELNWRDDNGSRIVLYHCEINMTKRHNKTQR